MTSAEETVKSGEEHYIASRAERFIVNGATGAGRKVITQVIRHCTRDGDDIRCMWAVFNNNERVGIVFTGDLPNYFVNRFKGVEDLTVDA